MTEKKVDIKERYRREILDIENILRDLEKGEIYDITKTKGQPYLYNAVGKIREKLNDLIFKAENDEQSANERLREAMRKVNSDSI
ncbi:hypothetical protein P4607_22870 [Priestia megaterium]|uniref:hypothetical protein n=1 Tax=Priestia megaterium TaxID=1404 RepID=UPI002E1D8AEB|nr:hypothetical protein [Priestia megaterium]